MLEREIENLEKEINYLEEEIKLKKKIYGGEMSWYDEKKKLDKAIEVRNLLCKLNTIPSEKFEIPSKTVSPTIRLNGNELFVEFSFREGVWQNLYNYVCDSYSELYSSNNQLIRQLFDMVGTLPKMTIDVDPRYTSFEKHCQNFYDNVITTLDFLQTDLAKIILDVIDDYYLKLIDYQKNRD